MLPKNTSLGTLEYVEVYDYYDFPQFFSCKNSVGEIYLALLVDEEPFTYLFALIKDPSILVLANYGLNTEDFYLYLDQKIYKVIVSDENIAVETSQSEVKSYFSDYIQKQKEEQKAFAEFLKQIHRE